MILLTGSTGFLGREILRTLLSARSLPIIKLLVRPHSKQSAAARIETLVLELFPEPHSRPPFNRIQIVEGDLSAERLGLSETEFDALASDTSSIIHNAALTSFDLTLQEARRINVNGMKTLLELAKRACVSGAAFRRFSHVSTAYVAGNKTGLVYAEELDLTRDFRNAYEQTKAEAETMLREMRQHFEFTITRPSIIVGRHSDGMTSNFSGLYVLSRLIANKMVQFIPGIGELPFDVVPVDYVAQVITHLHENEKAANRNFHVCAGFGRETTPLEVIQHMARVINNGFNKSPEPFTLPPFIAPDKLEKLSKRMGDVSASSSILNQTLPFVPYITSTPRFDMSQSSAVLPAELSEAPLFSDYGEKIFTYCMKSDWGKRRTI